MRDTTKLNPLVQRMLIQLVADCYRDKLYFGISETFRTVEEQNNLYAQGRTKSGKIVTNAKGSSYSSVHMWGDAVDFYLLMDIDKDNKINDDIYNNKKNSFDKIAARAKTLGFAWGGDWKSIVDIPHIQLNATTPNGTTAYLKKKYGTVSKYKSTWNSSYKVPFNFASLSVSTMKKKLTNYFDSKTTAECTLYKKDSSLEGKYRTLSKGTRLVHIKDMKNGWSKVRYANTTGYVKNSCLSLTNKKELSGYKQVKINKKCNFRKTRKIVANNVILSIQKDQTVKVVCTKGTWAQVKFGGNTGYVKKKFLR